MSAKPILEDIGGQGGRIMMCTVCGASEWAGPLVHRPLCDEITAMVRAYQERIVDDLMKEEHEDLMDAGAIGPTHPERQGGVIYRSPKLDNKEDS